MILGILTAVAVPKFIDLRTEAQTCRIAGCGGCHFIGERRQLRWSLRQPYEREVTQGLTCQTAAAAILEGGIPDGYTLDNTTTLGSGANTCTITRPQPVETADAIIIGIL